jgi:hypothetical protein
VNLFKSTVFLNIILFQIINPIPQVIIIIEQINISKCREKQMNITLITVGKIKEKYLKDAIDEYSKRLKRYCKLDIIEVADEKTPDNASEKEELQIKASYTLSEIYLRMNDRKNLKRIYLNLVEFLSKSNRKDELIKIYSKLALIYLDEKDEKMCRKYIELAGRIY